MDCPVCTKEPMITLELNEVEVDYCVKCKGIWLDEGELEILLGDSSQSSKLLKSFRNADKITEKKRKCPICLKKMNKIAVGKEDKDVIIIDKCQNNHGLWFDKGELSSMVAEAKMDENDKILRLLKDIFAQD